jgi:hypothetical protein
MNEPHACTFNRDQRCLKGAGCAAHGIECMRRTAALSFTMDRTQDAADAARDGVEREARNEPTSSDVERMRDALEKLANAADDVGVQFFDTDTMSPEVEAMQAATQEARALLSLSRERETCGAGAAAFGGRQSLPAALQDWLVEIEEYLQDRHDIRDGAPGGPHPLPNEEMSLSNALKSALGEQP